MNNSSSNEEVGWWNKLMIFPREFQCFWFSFSERNGENCDLVANRDRTADGTHPPERANADEIHSHLQIQQIQEARRRWMMWHGCWNNSNSSSSSSSNNNSNNNNNNNPPVVDRLIDIYGRYRRLWRWWIEAKWLEIFPVFFIFFVPVEMEGGGGGGGEGRGWEKENRKNLWIW